MLDKHEKFLLKLVEGELLLKSDIKRARFTLAAGNRGWLPIFERNIAAVRLLHQIGARRDVLRAALFLETPPAVINRLSLRAKRIATSANSLNGINDPREFARRFLATGEPDAFAVHAAARAAELNSIALSGTGRGDGRRLAEDTLHLHIRLANLLAMKRLEHELGEAALKAYSADEHAEISAKLDSIAKRQQISFKSLERIVREHAEALNCNFAVKVRPRKSTFSVWQKRNSGRDSFHDAMGMRLILYTSDSHKIHEFCNRLLRDKRLHGAIRRRDYLGKRRKQLGHKAFYEGVHLTVWHGGAPSRPHQFEVQVRTDKMDRVARLTYALHKGFHLPLEMVRQIRAMRREN